MLFVNVDIEGNVIDSLYGTNIIPDREYDHFFMVSQEVAENAFKYKVVMDGAKPSLVKK